MSIAALQALWNERGGRFARVGPKTRLVDLDGVQSVPETPNELARAAGLDVETYALSRMLASEGYSGDDSRGRAATFVGMAWTVRNAAQASGMPVSHKLTWSNKPAAKWHFGEQITRYASTRNDPSEWDVAVARAVLSAEVRDPTGGATMFFDPFVQDGGVQAGRAIKPAEEILERWHERNAYVGGVPGTDPYAIMFLRPERDASQRAAAYAQAIADVNEGRTRVAGGGGVRRTLAARELPAGAGLVASLVAMPTTTAPTIGAASAWVVALGFAIFAVVRLVRRRRTV